MGRGATLALCLAASLTLGWGFGFDNRRPLPTRHPYQSVGRISAHGGMGSGVLVGPDLFLTVAHAVNDNKSDHLYDDISVDFGYRDGQARSTAKAIHGWFIHQFSGDLRDGEDWCLLRLDQSAGDQYGFLRCREVEPEKLLQREVSFLGFSNFQDEAKPQFLAGLNPFEGPGHVREVSQNIFHVDCAASGGGSGGPIVGMEKGTPVVLGILAGEVTVSGETMNHGFKTEYVEGRGNVVIQSRCFLKTLQELSGSHR